MPTTTFAAAATNAIIAHLSASPQYGTDYFWLPCEKANLTLSIIEHITIDKQRLAKFVSQAAAKSGLSAQGESVVRACACACACACARICG